MKLGIPRRHVGANTAGIALAGLQAGVLAGLVALIYLMLDGAIRGRGLWAFANLLSATIYHGRPLSPSFRWATLAGVALHLILSGLVGIAFTFLIVRFASKPLRGYLIAGCLGLIWYYAACRFLWPSINPAVVVYQPFPGMILAHLLFGFCLGLAPSFARDIGPVGKQRESGPFL